jgi:cell shape-determining protein MreC
VLETIKKLINNLNNKVSSLERENEKLKKKLGHRNVTINDLRYSKKQLLSAISDNDKR